jgi:hypothetical protein
MLRVTVLLLLFLANLVLSVPRPNTNITEDEIIKVLAQYEVSASQKCRDYVEADWNYNTDVENETKVEELVSKNCILLKD